MRRLKNPMAYNYDVFISYRRPTKRWVSKYFKRLIEHYLPEALDGRPVRIFFDENDIHTGDAWENRLKKALSESKCLVPVLTPSYFTSNWCTKEFAVMENRSLKHGFHTVQAPGGLIVPITINQGKFYPLKIQALPCYEYYMSRGDLDKMSFWEDFERKIADWISTDLAKAIKQAPAWNEVWQQDEWLEVPTDHIFRKTEETENFQPIL